MSAPYLFMPCKLCCPQCVACKDRAYPDEITVTFSGIPNTGGCNDCSNANGSWVLHKNGNCYGTELGGTHQAAIQYIGEFSNVPMCQCGLGPGHLYIVLYVFWNYGAAGRRVINVVMGNHLGCVAVLFQLVESDQTEPFDCTNFGALAIPWSESGLYCSGGGSCTLST